jgi:hypothetical protein
MGVNVMSAVPRLWVAAIVAAGFLTACASPQKAQILKTTAIQFSVEADAAILAIDEMHKRELASPPRSDTEAVDQFVTDVLDWDPSEAAGGPIDGDNLELLIDPDKVDLIMPARQAWTDFISGLRQQYATFAAIFERLPEGSFLAVTPVEQSEAPARKLTAQLAAFAVSMDKHPPRLIQSRNAIANKLNSVRDSQDMGLEQKRREIAELRERAVEVIATERELQRAVVEQLVKASALGVEVSQLIDEYDQLSVDDLLFLSQQALGIAGQVTGEDYSRLQGRASNILSNPDWRPLVDEVLKKANDARATSTAGL